MTNFRDAIRSKDFVITVEPALHTRLTRDSLGNTFEQLAGRVDAVQIGDNEEAEGHISPLAIASIALSQGVDPVVHISARDRNRIALHADILGAAALGVTSLVLKRGNKLPVALKGRVKGVFDSRTAQVLELGRRLSDTSPAIAAPGLLLGSVITVIDPEPDWPAERVKEKLDAGAGFLQARACLNLDWLTRYAAALVALKLTHRATFIAAVPLLTSALDLRWFNENLPETVIAKDLPERILGASDSRAEGIRYCREMISALRDTPGISGVNINYRGDVADIVEVLQG
ncbi:MAG: methylenetetrahydrofolate reductase [Woeseiaceae bacterium]